MKKIVVKNILNKDVSVNIVDNEKDASFITHSGTFHADEVMATVFLLNCYDEINLYRTNNVTNNNAFCYDVGFGLYDHHQSDFEKTRDNGIKYASCGLIWDKVYKEIANKINIDEVYLKDVIENNLVMDIDRDDNGQKIELNPNIKIQGIPNLIASFNPNWNDKKNENECFLKALEFANTIFNNIISNILSKMRAKDIVEKAIEESNDNILILDRYMPWKDIVLQSKNKKANDILYAIFPSKRGGYNVVATPIQVGSFDVKKPFPNTWAGKNKEDLRKITGVKTFNFCHKNLFICACDTFEDALKIAQISIKNE